MRRTLVTLLIALFSWSAAADVVVHPFRSQDPLVGVAVAERVAGALTGVAVLGPEVAPTLVAPIVVPGGFLNPLAVAPAGAFDRTGIALLAGAVGVPVAVSGQLTLEAESVRLELVATVDGRLHSATVRADGSDLDLLVRRALPLVARWAAAGTRPPRPLDLTGPDQDATRARALIGAGFYIEALEALERVTEPDATDARLLEDLRAALAATGDGDPALAAMASLASADAEVPARAFARWSAAGGPPVADVWAAAWARSVDDEETARAAFAAAADAYAFGRAAAAADLVGQGDEAGARGALLALEAEREPAALLAGAFAANALGDATAEDRLLAALGRAAPFFAYPFERRSFIAFDREDALTAAETLAVAVELEPDSDLYWTNLGWAWYLLGFLDRSESASLRALELDASQYIARYNLGLVRVVTDRLESALEAYREAVRLDPAVDREAIADLVAAERDFPEAVGVSFALGFLLDRGGERSEAADAYERYLRRVELEPTASGADTARAREAAARVAALRAPLPPIVIETPPVLTLGRRGPVADPARPGDPLVLTFEVTTPGDALPRTLDLRAEVFDAAGSPVAVDEARVDVPAAAIGYVLDLLQVELPVTLAPGAYTVDVVATGDGLEARSTRTLVVEGTPDRVRRLIGRGLVPTALESGQALVAERDLAVDAAVVWARWVAELQAAAPLAEEALPLPESGRFAGMSGGEAFAATSEADVIDFVDHLLDSGARLSTFALADAYAQWVLDGAP